MIKKTQNSNFGANLKLPKNFPNRKETITQFENQTRDIKGALTVEKYNPETNDISFKWPRKGNPDDKFNQKLPSGLSNAANYLVNILQKMS